MQRTTESPPGKAVRLASVNPNPLGAPPGYAERALSRMPTDEDRAWSLHATAEHRGELALALRAVPRVATAPDQLGLRDLSVISTKPPAPMLIDRLDPDGHTILFGDGGIGKGTLSSSWLLQITKNGHRPLIVDYENHPEEWARRIFGLGGNDELRSQIGHVAPLTPAWKGAKGAIWDQQADLRGLIEAHEYDFVLIDSIVPACGATNASDTEAASQYAGALEYLGVPALSLAHVNRARDYSKPFGSAFWHNLARVTWSMEREGDLVLMKSRKANNYRRPAAQTVEVFWNDQGLPIQIEERPYQQTLASRIHEVLAVGPLTVAAIGTALNEDVAEEDKKVKSNNIRSALNRNEGSLFIKLSTDKEPLWARSDYDATAN